MARKKLEVSADVVEAARGKLKELATRRAEQTDPLLPLKSEILAAVKNKATLKDVAGALAEVGISVSSRTLGARIKDWKK